jgi:hypothetical protein
MELPFYNGPYIVLPREMDSIRKVTPSLGEVMRQRSNVLVLRCPACRALQFTAASISGPDDSPTTSPIHCGAGTCKRCGIWFKLVDGRAALVPAPVDPTPPVPAKLAEAGVKKAPKLPEG